ncbi:hypothetical protein BHE74_00031053 [Ensete ventricosum]|nr:hypothetical protein BHE74_00031053 [Ensete ventricosum]
MDLNRKIPLQAVLFAAFVGWAAASSFISGESSVCLPASAGKARKGLAVLLMPHSQRMPHRVPATYI